MPFSGTTFTKLYNWLTDPQRNEKIFNSRLDDEFSGLATGLTTLAASSIFASSFNRDISLTSALAITGVGFAPKVVFFLSVGVSSTKFGGIGFDNGAVSPFLEVDFPDAGLFQQPQQIIRKDATNYNFFSISSMDADGFTLVWTKTGTPTGTATIHYLALR